MLISHYNNILYIFVGIVVAAGIFLSRTPSEGSANFFNDRKPSMWFVSALSIFTVSIFQFWLLLLPVLSLSLFAVLIIFSLTISMMLPIILVKNRYTDINRFMGLISAKMKMVLMVLVVLFFAVIQPFALLYIGEKVIARFLGISYNFLLVFMITTAALSTLIGGKKVVIYSNALFGIVVIASMLAVMYLGNSLYAPVAFLQMFFTEGTLYFQHHNFFESSWFIGFVGFSVITWWMWWIDNGAFHLQRTPSEQWSGTKSLFVSIPLTVISLVFFSLLSRGESPPMTISAPAISLAGNELLMFFFVSGVVSVMVSVFSYSFQTVATIVAAQFFQGKNQPDNEEKYILIARLVIVLSALLTILYIPFAQYLGALTLLVYVQYLACFAASIVGVFTVFVFWKKLYRSGITSGILGGISAGLIIVYLTYSEAEILSPLLATPYGAATGIFIFSMICSIGGSVIVEPKVTKDSIAV